MAAPRLAHLSAGARPFLRSAVVLVRDALMAWGLFTLYRIVRLVVKDEWGAAMNHAGDVLRIESVLGLRNEASMQRLVLGWPSLVRAANIYYATVHFAATIAFLCWLFLWRRDGYRRCARLLIAMTAMALVVHLVYPLAPPRLLPDGGFVDTGLVYGPSPYRAGSATAGSANQIAAMPSMHFGWAVAVGWGVIRYGHSRLRWAVIVHPLVTLFVIVVTANHYWLDAVVALALFAAALQLTTPRCTAWIRGWPAWRARLRSWARARVSTSRPPTASPSSR